jgi:hypothetical protein
MVASTELRGCMYATHRTCCVFRPAARRRVKHTIPEPLLMPTTITGQNGAVWHTTKIAVTGCAANKPKPKPKKKSKAKHRKGKRQ